MILLICTGLKHREVPLPVTGNPYPYSLAPSKGLSHTLWKWGKSKPNPLWTTCPLLALSWLSRLRNHYTLSELSPMNHSHRRFACRKSASSGPCLLPIPPSSPSQCQPFALKNMVVSNNILTARYIAAYMLSAASLDGKVFLAFTIRSGFPVQACTPLMNCVYCLHPSAV